MFDTEPAGVPGGMTKGGSAVPSHVTAMTMDAGYLLYACTPLGVQVFDLGYLHADSLEGDHAFDRLAGRESLEVRTDRLVQQGDDEHRNEPSFNDPSCSNTICGGPTNPHRRSRAPSTTRTVVSEAIRVSARPTAFGGIE